MTGRALIDNDRLLDRLGAEAELLAGSIDETRLTELVPGCPGLTLGETARHVGSVHRMVWKWLREGQRPTDWRAAPAPGQTLAGFVRSGVAPLLAELSAHEPGQPCSTWWPDDQTYGFWSRRMAHETTVHRVDVQGAADAEIAEVAEDIAVDGIDEVLTLWFGHRLREMNVAGTRRHTVLIRAGGREWLSTTTTDNTGTRRAWSAESTSESAGEAAAEAVVTGSPMDVYLWLWGRLPNRRVRLSGDGDAVAQLWALLRLATR
ncbi:MAG TPA: maleylpyruvate isomerase N-terminal domain-containing protein [Pseudonocardiaceae bacterium]